MSHSKPLSIICLRSIELKDSYSSTNCSSALQLYTRDTGLFWNHLFWNQSNVNQYLKVKGFKISLNLLSKLYKASTMLCTIAGKKKEHEASCEDIYV